ncbi:MAG TPA: hypothetical protein VFH45_04745, partial [Acidimicrobiales bacterium]|nr:hypothetical protein [Acidimicrobiales bacterium]
MTVTDWAGSEAERERLAAERVELESERDYLLGSLRQLEHERAQGELSDEDYTALHHSYTARAAEVLRRLDALEPVAATGGPAGPPAAGGPAPEPAEAVGAGGARRWLGR